ncbi:hypothetical protein HDU89_005531 [Geranomyces variabilis]|nr:hypothetical protein HDU89_005531 [Geranomyces variabilis]
MPGIQQFFSPHWDEIVMTFDKDDGLEECSLPRCVENFFDELQKVESYAVEEIFVYSDASVPAVPSPVAAKVEFPVVEVSVVHVVAVAAAIEED